MSRAGCQLNVRVDSRLRRDIDKAAELFGTVSTVVESALASFLEKSETEQMRIVKRANRKLKSGRSASAVC